MWGVQLARYRGWILQGATREQWSEIATALRKKQYAAFIVYKDGKPVDVRGLININPLQNFEFKKKLAGGSNVTGTAAIQLCRSIHEDVRNSGSSKLRR